MSPIERADRRPEEAAYLIPLRAASEQTCQRQDPARVSEPPHSEQRIGRHRELEVGYTSAGPHDPRQLPDRRAGVSDVAQQVRERQRIERGVSERQLLTTSEQQPDAIILAALGDPLATAAQHLLGEVDCGDRRARTLAEHEGHAGRPGGYVEHLPRRWVHRDDSIDHGGPPAAILAERKHLSQRVVPAGQAVEQFAGELVRRPGWPGNRMHPGHPAFVGRQRAVPRFDAVIVGAGPAGSTAALCLARAGARVALVDRRAFPRDKACGDLVGPRGVRLLAELGVSVTDVRRVGDLVVVGPSGRRALLPALPGRDYPGYALAVSRFTLDRALFDAAVTAGAVPVRDLVVGLTGDPHRPTGVELASGGELGAEVVVGADGATSRVATAAGLLDDRRALWGFALRAYLDAAVDLPHILLWEPEPWQLFPGYGWIFPTADGRANVGLGVGVGADRLLARRAGERFGQFCDYLHDLGLLPAQAHRGGQRLGGWLKMGMVGTLPGRATVLLAGDAAGLINPLQGEGIAQAMASGRAAATAILVGGPAGAAAHYRHSLYGLTAHHRINAPVHRGIVRRPRSVSVAGRVLTAPLVRTAIAGAWSLYWNDLVRGAEVSAHQRMAAGTTRLVAAIASSTDADAWFRSLTENSMTATDSVAGAS
jgi:menaquinone-9 beta-reductase